MAFCSYLAQDHNRDNVLYRVWRGTSRSLFSNNKTLFGITSSYIFIFAMHKKQSFPNSFYFLLCFLIGFTRTVMDLFSQVQNQNNHFQLVTALKLAAQHFFLILRIQGRNGKYPSIMKNFRVMFWNNFWENGDQAWRIWAFDFFFAYWLVSIIETVHQQRRRNSVRDDIGWLSWFKCRFRFE